MFNKLKQIKDLRDQAKHMQSVLGQESTTVEKSGCKIMMNGNMEVTSLTINAELTNDKKEDVLKHLINDAVKETQKIMAKKLQAMGGLDKLGL